MDIQIDDILNIGEKQLSVLLTIEKGIIEIDSITINFISNLESFNLTIYEQNDTWVPNMIGHGGPLKKERCPYCKSVRMMYYCETLSQYLDEVFEKVMNHPKVRLRKLFF